MLDKKLSAAEKVLLSAFDLLEHKQEFTAEDLIVKCWEKYKEDFSLQNYEIYPNSNAVLLHLMNKNGPLLKKGWIVKNRAKIYSLTDTGLLHCRNLLSSNTQQSNNELSTKTNKINISRDLKMNIKSFLSNRVSQQILRKDDYQKLQFNSACSFWKVHQNMTYPEINAKLKNVENWINELKNYLKNKKTDFLKLDNVFLKKDDIDCLDEANSFFLKKFNNDIEWFKSNRPNASNNKKSSL